MSNNIFEKLKTYPDSWMQVYSRPFNEREVRMVEYCEVVEGQYSLLLECRLRNGAKRFFPITKDSSDAYVGLVPDLTTDATLVEFEKNDKRCIKVRIKF